MYRTQASHLFVHCLFVVLPCALVVHWLSIHCLVIFCLLFVSCSSVVHSFFVHCSIACCSLFVRLLFVHSSFVVHSSSVHCSLVVCLFVHSFQNKQNHQPPMQGHAWSSWLDKHRVFSVRVVLKVHQYITISQTDPTILSPCVVVSKLPSPIIPEHTPSNIPSLKMSINNACSVIFTSKMHLL